VRLKIYQGKWNVVWHDGTQTRRKSLGTADRQVAERRYLDVKIERPEDTVADAVALYLKEKEETGARSYEAMEASWKALMPMFGHLRPEHIDAKLCRKFAKARRSAGRADGTIIKDLGFLRTALKWAKRPGATFELPETPDPRDRYLTREEFTRFLAQCKLLHIRLFVILAISTAARASALLELTWDRVNFQKGLIRLSKAEERRKGRATVPMTDSVREALQDAWESRGDGEHVIEWAGKPIRSVKRAFRLAAAKAGLEEVTPHVLRHSAAVWAIEDGASIPEVGQFLGHTDLKTTYRVYAKYSPGHMKKVAKSLEIGSARLVDLNHKP
jgi:integrase